MKQRLSMLVLALLAVMVTSFTSSATIYARLERGTLTTQYHNGYNVSYWSTVEVHFYSHPSCAPQYAIQTPTDIDVTVNLEEWDYPPGGGSYSSNTPYTLTAYSGSYYVDGWFGIRYIYCYDGSTDTVEYTLSLVPSPDYVIVT